MFMFIIYALLIYIMGLGVGKFFIKKESKLYPLRSVIGFVIFMGVLEVLYLPLEYFNLSSSYSNIITLLLSISSLVLGFIHIKKDDFSFLKDYHFYMLLVLLFGIMKIIPSVDATDDAIYFPLIMDNAYNNINTIAPDTGILGNLDAYHSYQGFYIFISFIYKIQHLIFNSFTDIFIVFRSTFTLLFALYFSSILSYLKSIFKKGINSYIYILLEVLSVLLIGVQHLNHLYFGSFALFSIFIPLYMIVINNSLKESNLKAILLMEVGLISLASSSLFLILMILSVLFSYEVLVNKKVDITSYLLESIPCGIYAILLINKLILIPVYLLLILILYIFRNTLNKVLSKYGKYIVYSIPFIFILGSILLKGFINISLFSKSILLFNFLMLTILLYLVLIKKEKINFYVFLFILMILIYYNPFTSTLVSRYLTTKEVFYRISFITKNPLTIISIFIFILKAFDKKYLKIGLYIFIGGLTILYTRNLYTLMIKNDDYFYDYNYILRESKENLEVGDILTTLEGKVVSLDFPFRSYNTTLSGKIYRFLGTAEYSDNIYEVLHHNYFLSDGFFNEIKEYDYIISQNRYNTSLSTYYNELFRNNSYTIFETKNIDNGLSD